MVARGHVQNGVVVPEKGATFLEAGIASVLTTHPSDLATVGVFQCTTPGVS